MQIWCYNNQNPGFNGPHHHFGEFIGRNEAGMVKSTSHGPPPLRTSISRVTISSGGVRGKPLFVFTLAEHPGRATRPRHLDPPSLHPPLTLPYYHKAVVKTYGGDAFATNTLAEHSGRHRLKTTGLPSPPYLPPHASKDQVCPRVSHIPPISLGSVHRCQDENSP